MIALVRALMPGEGALLRPTTFAAMQVNQLAPGQWITFSMLGPMPGKGHGLAGSLAVGASPLDAKAQPGEIAWGGVAGTHWWICPRTNTAGLMMAQRYMAFWNPFYFDFKTRVATARGW
jgi:CubicO group peptidase (beta-lactamase class C family)